MSKSMYKDRSYNPTRLALQFCTDDQRQDFWDAVRGKCSGEALFYYRTHDRRALAVEALFYEEAPPEVLRSAARAAWLESYSVLEERLRWTGGGRPDIFMDVFRRAAFPVPDELPDMLTVYHGDNGANPDDLFSWTTSRAAACWWAMRQGDEPLKVDAVKNPRVLRRVIPKSSIVFYEPFGCQPHDEIGCDLPLGDHEIDGTPDEWERLSVAFMRMAHRTSWGGGEEAPWEPTITADEPAPASWAERYADRANWPDMAGELFVPIRGELPERYRGLWDGTLAGRTSPAWFVDKMPADLAGKAIVALYLNRAKPDDFRYVLKWCWQTYPRSLSDAAALLGPDALVDMFKSVPAGYTPTEWGETIELFRGVRGKTLEEARIGLSWTTDYHMAAVWALHYLPRQGINGDPLILRRVVNRDEVLAYMPPPHISEVIIGTPGGEVHGDINDWHAAIEWLKKNHSEAKFNQRVIAAEFPGRLIERRVQYGTALLGRSPYL